MKSVPVKTCTNIDCPERTGGNCNAGESVPVKSPEMEYSATYDLSRSVPVLAKCKNMTGNYFWKRENGLYYHRIFSNALGKYFVFLTGRQKQNGEIEQWLAEEEQKILRIKKTKLKS